MDYGCSHPVRLDKLAHAAHGGQDAEKRPRPGAQYLFVVDEHLELPIATGLSLDFHVGAQPAPELGRHPGGVEARYSVPATTDGHAHGTSQRE